MRTLTLALALSVFAWPGRGTTTETLVIRGRPQALRVSGPRDGQPVVVSSGDGGWVHLGPHVAELLSTKGYFVVGFDTRAYLSSFTTGHAALRIEDEPRDYQQLVTYAAGPGHRRPILLGVSEGAGLSVLAATDPSMQAAINGVVAVGLPAVNELGWRWKDALIYLTHGVPNEPSFRTRDLVAQVAPLPLAVIHSTHDEFVPASQMQDVFSAAGEPKKAWMVLAGDHRFSDNLEEFDRRLLEALSWVQQHAAAR